MDSTIPLKEKSREAPDAALTPPLKWAGGKRWLVPALRELWRGHESSRLVEPFVGGLAVALGLRPERALLNDTNSHVVNFYRWVQRGLAIAIPVENSEELYYRHRERFNTLLAQGKAESREAAELFYYLNRTGYNGLCRFNSKGFFNVPFGKYRNVNYRRDLYEYREALAGWEFWAGDFTALDLEPGDFVYADPPYDVQFTSYSAGGFGWKDQVRLAECLAAHQGPVVASNQATARVLDLYKSLGFRIEIVSAPRMIACNGDRTRAMEMLALKGL